MQISADFPKSCSPVAVDWSLAKPSRIEVTNDLNRTAIALRDHEAVYYASSTMMVRLIFSGGWYSRSPAHNRQVTKSG